MHDIQHISDLIERFGKSDNESSLSEISDSLIESFEKIRNSVSNLDIKNKLSEVHHCGITLWNIIIAKRARKVSSSITCAKACFVALNLTFIAASNERSQTSSRKILAMAMKTGKEWLDLNNFEKADNSFVIATECYMKFQNIIENVNSSIRLSEEQIAECHNNMMKVNAFRAEIALKQNQHATALEYFKKALTTPGITPKQTEFLFSISYNFGLDCYQRELYQFAVEWLCEAVESINSDGDDVVSKEKKASMYQLLSMAYIKLAGEENFKKAAEAIELSNKLKAHYKNIHLQIKVAVNLKQTDDQILEGFQSLCAYADLDLNTALQSIDFISQNENLAEKALELVSKKFTVFVDNLKIQIKRLEIVMANRTIAKAKELIEGDLMALNTYGSSFDKDSLKQLHLLLWEQAQSFYEKGDISDSLYWYNYSYAFMKQSPDDKVNMAKLQRNRCSCLIELKNFIEAEKAAQEALDQHKSSPFVYFLLYKIALMQGKEEDAIKYVQEITTTGLSTGNIDAAYGLICMAAQLAFEKQNLKISEMALMSLLDSVKKPEEATIIIRCLTRLKFSQLSKEYGKNDILFLISLIERALENLTELYRTSQEKSILDEITWFNKIAWNIALSCKNLMEEMQLSFSLCYKFSLLLPQHQINIQQQKTCLVMSAGCNLTVIRESNCDDKIRDKRLLEVLDCVQKCKDICSKMETINDQKIDSSSKFLLSYEFEAKARLGYKDLDKLLDITLNSDRLPKAKIFENYAGIASSLPSEDMNKLAIKCLKLSIKCHLEENEKDFDTVSKLIHNLINLTMQKGSFSKAASKEEAYVCYNDALNVIDVVAEGAYPEIEIVWLMTKAWNCGIHLYSANYHEHADKWCTISMKFLTYLNELKSTYESHMISVYEDISKRINQSKVHAQIEE